MSQKAAIIIVNWNGKKFLKNCLEAVFAQEYKNFEVYLVDNGSADESLKFVKDNFPRVKTIGLNKNTGFAKGNNEGIKVALLDKEVKHIVCLNNDTIVDKNWLESLVAAVDYRKKIDMVSSLCIFPDGRVQSIGIRFEKDLCGAKEGGLAIGFKESPKKYQEKKEIFCPNGASCLFTRRLLERVGLFDEDFFAYGEDLDLGMRARKAGYKCIFTPESKLVHLHSMTSGGPASPLKAYLVKRNVYFVAIKNFTLTDLLLFPLRDLEWNIKNIFNQGGEKSSNILKKRVGLFGIVWILLKAYTSVIYSAPKMIIKRLCIK